MPSPSLQPLHSSFLSILPRIQLHARISFRHVRCPFTREDLIAEMVGICWRWFRRLVERGKNPTRFVSALATFATRAVRSGRRLVGMEPGKDVLSPSVQQRHAFTVGKLPAVSTRSGNPLEDALRDNTVSPVPEQVCFRLDFPAWRRTRCQRDRRIVDDLMCGERTLDVARKHGTSPARVSQLRRELHRDWVRFHGDAGSDKAPAA
jgi:hypothetical protein